MTDLVDRLFAMCESLTSRLDDRNREVARLNQRIAAYDAASYECADEVERLRQIIEDAPHAEVCIRSRVFHEGECDCWKSKLDGD